PGEDVPHHDSFQRKLDHAPKFREQFRVRRRILVDDLDGSGHRAFGGLPNMTYILSSAHTVLFRSAWTDSATVKVALDYLLDVQARRGRGLGWLLFTLSCLDSVGSTTPPSTAVSSKTGRRPCSSSTRRSACGQGASTWAPWPAGGRRQKQNRADRHSVSHATVRGRRQA